MRRNELSSLGGCRALLAIIGGRHAELLTRCMAFVLMGVACHAQTVLFVSRSSNSADAKAQVELASHFYGLDVQDVVTGKPGQSERVIKALRSPDLLAALISGDALSSLDQTEVFAALRRPGKESVPLVLLDILPTDSTRLLSRWSNSSVTACESPDRTSESWELSFSEDRQFVEQLAGIQLPLKRKVKCGLVVTRGSSGKVLVEVFNPGERLPVLVTSVAHNQRVFLLPSVSQDENRSSVAGKDALNDAFSAIAPLMVALHYAAGDYAWHTPGHFANLTVDDAWLVEPYGNLEYKGLLGEMDKHNFHTTIAFIPWNFDRSRADVVSLFQSHPERISVCIHGNNHDHREFGDYGIAPLAEQAINIKQALARMERFTTLTGISYSRVMVFPHAVAPLQTFQELKKYNFWATTNSQNVPLGSVPPQDPLFALRPQTLDFKNFLSVKRYSAEVPVSPETIAVNAYLGNPLLFYVHQEFFHGDIGAFDRVADTVNKIEPASQWKSLGDITQHLYLIRKREDRDYDILTFSPNIWITNSETRVITFHVKKPEDFLPSSPLLTVDGKAFSYQSLGDGIAFNVPLSAGQSSHIEVSYANDLALAQIDVSQRGVRVAALRRFSDFRDLWLTRSPLGMKLTRVYYSYHFDVLELAIEHWELFLLTFVVASATWYRFVYLRKLRMRNLQRQNSKLERTTERPLT